MAKIKKTKPVLVIIDGNAIIHRAYHALPPMHTRDGKMVNAVYGFTSMMLRAINDLEPDYLAVSFDVSGGTFRDEIYTEYKAKRKKPDQELYDQIPMIRKMVESFGIPVFAKKGFEADDVLGTISEIVKQKHDDIVTVILTGDKDLLQLVQDDQTEVFLLKRGLSDVALFNEGRVFEKFGFGPERIIDYKSLCGDTSDNIPGVRGVGDKTATKLIQAFATIEAMYDKIKEEKWTEDVGFRDSVAKKMEIGKDESYMSRELATIKLDVPDVDFILADTNINKVDWNTAAEEIKKFEFFSLLRRLPGTHATAAPDKKKKVVTHKEVVVITSKEDVKQVIDQINKEKKFVCDASISGTIWAKSLHGLGIVVGENIYFLDFSRLESFSVNDVKEIFENKDVVLHGHDVKKLLKVLALQNIVVNNQLFDIMIGSYITNSSTRAHDFAAILMRELDTEIKKSDDQESLFGKNPKEICNGLEHILEISEIFSKKLVAEKQENLFYDIEMKLIKVLSKMEIEGILLDEKLLLNMSTEVHKQLDFITKNAYKVIGKEFNLSSSTQLREILFVDLELPTKGIKKGKTGYSTAASELEKLRGQHEIISIIEEYRELEKMRNTYIDVLPLLVNKKTDRIHTTFNQAVAATGRLSSSDPNLQNIPIRTEMGRNIRKAFIAKAGYKLLALDYSQFELRIVASLADDKTLIDIFKQGKDVHTATAAVIHDMPLDEVTKDIRRTAKEVNFGVLYGMGAFGLAQRTNLSVGEAKQFIAQYFDKFAGVKTYIETIVDQGQQNGYTETLFGRKRYIPELQSSNAMLRKAGERMAVNLPVQGTQADALKMAMIAVDNFIKKNNHQDDLKMLLQVHDELVFEVKQDKADFFAKEIKKIMEEIIELKVPIEVDSRIGERWGDL